MSTLIHEFGITVDQVDGYEYRIRFDKPQYPEIRVDEPEPLGKDAAPNAARSASRPIRPIPLMPTRMSETPATPVSRRLATEEDERPAAPQRAIACGSARSSTRAFSAIRSSDATGSDTKISIRRFSDA